MKKLNEEENTIQSEITKASPRDFPVGPTLQHGVSIGTELLATHLPMSGQRSRIELEFERAHCLVTSRRLRVTNQVVEFQLEG